MYCPQGFHRAMQGVGLRSVGPKMKCRHHGRHHAGTSAGTVGPHDSIDQISIGDNGRAPPPAHARAHGGSRLLACVLVLAASGVAANFSAAAACWAKSMIEGSGSGMRGRCDT
eukprot:COSAG02_NODE_1178_length_14042_cov_11.526674_16_plen_113_part_00